MDDPPVVVFMQEGHDPDPDRLESEGAFRAETSWPAPGADDHVLYLQEGGRLGAEPGVDGSDKLVYDPTVGVTAGLWSAGLPYGLPGDQRPDELASLTYTTDVLDEDLHMLGQARVELPVESSTGVIGFAVSLSDVLPDGTSALVAKGMLNVSRRDSLREPAALPPGDARRAADRPRRQWVGLPPRASHPRRGCECRLAERVANACAGDEPCAPRRGLARFHFAANPARRIERGDAGLPALARRRPAARRGGQAADLAGLARRSHRPGGSAARDRGQLPCQRHDAGAAGRTKAPCA